MAVSLPLDPAIAALCTGTPAAPAGAAAATATLVSFLYSGATAFVYAAGWSPAHVEGWRPFVEAEFGAAQRRATRVSRTHARRVQHFAISAGVVRPPRRVTKADKVAAEVAAWGTARAR